MCQRTRIFWKDEKWCVRGKDGPGVVLNIDYDEINISKNIDNMCRMCVYILIRFIFIYIIYILFICRRFIDTPSVPMKRVGGWSDFSWISKIRLAHGNVLSEMNSFWTRNTQKKIKPRINEFLTRILIFHYDTE